MMLLVENGPEMTCFILKNNLENDVPGRSLTLWLVSVVGYCTVFC